LLCLPSENSVGSNERKKITILPGFLVHLTVRSAATTAISFGMDAFPLADIFSLWLDAGGSAAAFFQERQRHMPC